MHAHINFFMWKMVNAGLPLKSNLAARNLRLKSVECVHGCQSVEDELHIFFQCEVAKRLWFASPWRIR